MKTEQLIRRILRKHAMKGVVISGGEAHAIYFIGNADVEAIVKQITEALQVK